MSKAKDSDFYREAVADASVLREGAIEAAKKELEEEFAPAIKNAITQTIQQEMEDEEAEEDEEQPEDSEENSEEEEENMEGDIDVDEILQFLEDERHKDREMADDLSNASYEGSDLGDVENDEPLNPERGELVDLEEDEQELVNTILDLVDDMEDELEDQPEEPEGEEPIEEYGASTATTRSGDFEDLLQDVLDDYEIVPDEGGRGLELGGYDGTYDYDNDRSFDVDYGDEVEGFEDEFELVVGDEPYNSDAGTHRARDRANRTDSGPLQEYRSSSAARSGSLEQELQDVLDDYELVPDDEDRGLDLGSDTDYNPDAGVHHRRDRTGQSQTGPLQENRKLKKRLQKNRKENRILRKRLSEANITSAKLLYMNRLLSETNLTEDQKEEIFDLYDKVSSVENAKLVYETIKNKSVVTEDSGRKKKSNGSKRLVEALRGGSFSKKSSGSSKKKKEDDDMKQMRNRFQELASLNKD